MSWVPKTIGAYLELARLSNIPTCWSNVLVGCAIGGLSGWADWPTIAMMALAISLLYIAGMALNDAADHKVDRQQRSERPIPSGRVSLRAAYIFAGITMATAIGLLTTLGLASLLLGLLLAASIIAYDYLHKKFAASAALMGLCRGLVYLAAAAAVAWPLDWTISLTIAGALTVYITIITFIAQTEVGSTTGLRRRLGIALPLVVLLPTAFVRAESWSWTVVVAVLAVLWLTLAARHALAQPPRTKNAVLTWLSGICLIDAFYLTLLDRPQFAAAALGCFVLTAIGHRYILGT